MDNISCSVDSNLFPLWNGEGSVIDDEEEQHPPPRPTAGTSSQLSPPSRHALGVISTFSASIRLDDPAAVLSALKALQDNSDASVLKNKKIQEAKLKKKADLAGAAIENRTKLAFQQFQAQGGEILKFRTVSYTHLTLPTTPYV